MCSVTRRMQFRVCEVMKSLITTMLFGCNVDLLQHFRVVLVRERVGKIKIAKYLSVLIIEIFRGHVCLHVGSVFMFVNLWKDLKF